MAKDHQGASLQYLAEQNGYVFACGPVEGAAEAEAEHHGEDGDHPDEEHADVGHQEGLEDGAAVEGEFEHEGSQVE